MADSNLKISIITASYNYEHFIKEAIESVIAQSYTNWELIVVDDGSKDNSVEVIKEYCEKDSRIKFFQHEGMINKGLRDTILLGLENANSEWVAFLESDDIFKPNYLEEKIKIINSDKDTGLIFNDVEFFGDAEQIRIYDAYLKRRENMLLDNNLKYVDFFTDNPIQTFSCVMVKKDLLISCDFNSHMPQNLDWHVWAQVLTKTNVSYIQKELTRWRLHPNSYINSTSREAKGKWASCMLQYLDKDEHNKFWYKFYAHINNTRLEKLLRPQVNFISNLIINQLLKNKSALLVKY